MNKVFLFLGLLLLVSSFTGCGSSQDIEDARNLGQRYYEAIKAKDLDSAMSFYSLEFFRETSKGETLQFLESIDSKLGNLQSYEYDYFEKTSYGGTRGRSVIYRIYYDVIYSKGSSRETLTFTKSEDGTFEILGFNIQSKDLLQ